MKILFATESLQEFKKNLAAGYNPAELKHGSVWILFVIKEQLADLPVPFRKDGFLLPFEWRNGAEITEHSPLLPEALREHHPADLQKDHHVQLFL